MDERRRRRLRTAGDVPSQKPLRMKRQTPRFEVVEVPHSDPRANIPVLHVLPSSRKHSERRVRIRHEKRVNPPLTHRRRGFRGDPLGDCGDLSHAEATDGRSHRPCRSRFRARVFRCPVRRRNARTVRLPGERGGRILLFLDIRSPHLVFWNHDRVAALVFRDTRQIRKTLT